MSEQDEDRRRAALVSALPFFLVAGVVLVYWIVPTLPVFGGATFVHRLGFAEVLAVFYAGFAGIAGFIASYLPRGRGLAIVGAQALVGIWFAWLFRHAPGLVALIGVVVFLRVVPQVVDYVRTRHIDPMETVRMWTTVIAALMLVVTANAAGRIMARYGLRVPAFGLTPEVEAAQHDALLRDAVTGFGTNPDSLLANSAAGLVFYFVGMGCVVYWMQRTPSDKLMGESTVAHHR